MISGFRIQCSVFRSEICELGLSWEREAGGTELGENFGLETGQGFLPVTRVLGSFGRTRPGFWEFCGKKLINRNHSRTECKNSSKMSILRGVFEGDINYDCIFTGFFSGHQGFGKFWGNPAECHTATAL